MYVKNNYFSSILYDESIMKYTKPKFKNGDRVTISKNDIKLQAYEKFTKRLQAVVYRQNIQIIINNNKEISNIYQKRSQKKKL